jgi:probable DNA metabolism protein
LGANGQNKTEWIKFLGNGEDDMKQIFVCNDTITGIFSAIYDAWKIVLSSGETGIALKGMMNQELFCEYTESAESEKKAIAVENMIKKNLGMEVYRNIYYAILAEDAKKANAVLGMMQEARRIHDKRKIMEHLSHKQVRKVFELKRTVENEAHCFQEFIRFSELESGVLFSKIAPKNQVLTCIADHFANRLPLENWMIYDETHQMLLIHRKQQNWFLVWNEKLNKEKINRVSYAENTYSELWKGFFENISIEERESYQRQRQHLPIRFRGNMVEFVQ